VSSGMSTEAILLIVIGVMGCIIIVGLTVGCLVWHRNKKKVNDHKGAIEFGAVSPSVTAMSTAGGSAEPTIGNVLDDNTPDSAPTMGANITNFSDGQILRVASMSHHSIPMSNTHSQEGALAAAAITRGHHISQINLHESMGGNSSSASEDSDDGALYGKDEQEAVPVLHESPGSFVVTPGNSASPGMTSIGAGTDLVDGMDIDAQNDEDEDGDDEEVGLYDKDNRHKTAGQGIEDALYQKPGDKATKE